MRVFTIANSLKLLAVGLLAGGLIGCGPHAAATATDDAGDDATDADAAVDGDTAGTDAATPADAAKDASPECVTAADCDDKNVCTTDACAGAAGCTHVANALACDDGDACTLGDTCKNTACAGPTAVACDDDNPCTSDSCVPATGCAHTFNTAACDDGNSCTTSDACAGGKCVGGNNTCPCKADADCKAFDNGNLCDGTLVCVAAVCQVNAGSIIVCPTGADTTCAKNKCAPLTGLCSQTPVADNASCDDGLLCTVGDACKSGVCTGTDQGCDDGNPCTTDACVAATGCSHTANPGVCDDGNPCTSNDLCTNSACAGAGTTDCSDGNACTDDGCDAKTGCTHANTTAPCDDGNSCTSGEACVAGSCGGGTATCACQKNADCAPFEDGNLCSGTLICTANACVIDATTVVTCSAAADTACVHAACDAATGTCKPTPLANGSACNDGSACTIGDACAVGLCAGTTLDCGDGNVCTADSCDPAAGCGHAPVAGSCDDGTACTSGDACAAGVCTGAAAWWAKGFSGTLSPDGTQIEFSLGMAITATDSAFIVGGGFDEVVAGQSQHARGWLFATTPTGAPLWSTKVADDGGVKAVATDGNRIVFTGRNGASAHVGRVTADGVVSWSKAIGTADADTAALALLPDGVVAGGGQFGVGANASHDDGLVVRLDNSGGFIWQKTYGGTGAEYVTAIAATASTLAIAGYSASTAAGDNDGWLVITDLDGNVQSEHKYGGAGEQAFTAITALPDGFLLAGGSTPPGADSNAYLVRTDLSGAELWHTTWGQAGVVSSLTGIVALGSGFAAVGGASGDAVTGTGATILLLNAAGTPEVASTFAVPGGAVPTLNGLVSWQGDLLAVGTTAGGVGGQALVVRASPWGQIACSDLCLGKTSADCDDGNACTGDVCDPQKGCVSSAKGVCDDGDLCTTDACAPSGACSHVQTSCADGLACTIDACDSATGKCSNTAKSCDDGLACTDDSCAPATGACSSAAKNCDDGDLCTADSCDAATGQCVHGTACNDGNGCTTDSCDANGCAHLPIANSTTCDDGNPCTVGDFCAGGTCAPGAPTLWQAMYGGTGDEWINGLAGLTDGAVFIGSTTSKGAGGTDAWLVRTGTDGSVQVDTTFGGTGSDTGSAVIAIPDGFVFAGSTASGFPNGASWLVRTDLKGVPVWNKTFDVLNKTDAFSAVAANAGGFVAGGSNDYTARAVQVDSNGLVTWDVTFPNEYGGVFNAVLPVADGVLLAGGGAPKASGLKHMCLIKTDLNGTQLWEQRFGTAAMFEQLSGIVAMGGGFVVAGQTGNPPRILYARTDAAGNILWQHTFKESSQSPPSLALAGNGGFVIGMDIANSYAVRGVGPVGEVQWTTPLGTDPAYSPMYVVATGATLLTGASVPPNLADLNSRDVRLWRVDPWANGDCTASGSCVTKGLAGCDDGLPCTVDLCASSACSHVSDSCDDGNPCTTDSCDAAKGCVNAAMDSGACDDGNGCTVADVCKAGACAPGPVNTCDDGIACTTDFCNPGSGNCSHAAQNTGCDDANACTTNVCNPDTGCTFPPTTGGCDDGNDCTANDACSGGTCVAGASEVDGKYISGICSIAGGCSYCASGVTVACTEAALQYSVNNVAVVACVPDYPSWGIEPLTPNSLTDNGDGTVTDSFTHLMWTKDVDFNVGWYCSSSSVGGFKDWREPSRTELYSILNWSAVVANDGYSPALLVAPFLFHSANGPSGAFEWTGFTTASATRWAVGFTNGTSAQLTGTSNSKAAERCVRVLQAEPLTPKRFTVNASAGTVSDTVTQRTWTQSESPGTFSTQADASAYCGALTTDGGGWRLPDIRELTSLVDSRKSAPAIDSVTFPATTVGDVPTWSDTPKCSGCATFAVDFTSGANVMHADATAGKVRCVR